MKSLIHGVTLVAGLLVATGCQPAVEGEGPASAASDGKKYLLDAEPAGAQDVIAVRESAKTDDEVVIVGRIGGRENPWPVKEQAIFTIVDPSLNACSDIPDDNCKTPWDYCCETQRLPTSTALVQIVDETGRPVAEDARKLLAVKELDTVVVKGKAVRDDEGNLEILATGLYVRPPS
ncbi:MAG: hypothetical protein RIC55_21280 [Pirellulaceae bacterium]